jgi:hypothetical protein
MIQLKALISHRMTMNSSDSVAPCSIEYIVLGRRSDPLESLLKDLSPDLKIMNEWEDDKTVSDSIIYIQ